MNKMNKIQRRLITGVRGIHREVIDKSPYKLEREFKNDYRKGGYVFLHRITPNGFLCPKSIQWYEKYNNYSFCKIHFFEIYDIINPFGIVFSNEDIWKLNDIESFNEQLKYTITAHPMQ